VLIFIVFLLAAFDVEILQNSINAVKHQITDNYNYFIAVYRILWHCVNMQSMGIKIKIRELAERRGITNAYQLQKFLEMKSPTKAALLWDGTMDKIGIATIELVCLKFKVKPNQIFEVAE